jgi:hypothetical protein
MPLGLESPTSNEVSFTPSANPALQASSLFSPSDTPAIASANDPNPVELGVKFQTATAGQVIGVRFYKGPENTGTHVCNLWNASGSLLATAAFSNESSSGWQQVNLSSPVSIAANTIYVVSYHNNGDYSADNDYFDTAAQTNGPLTAPATGSVGGNDVYAYGSTSNFPTTNTWAPTTGWTSSSALSLNTPEFLGGTISLRTLAVSFTARNNRSLPSSTLEVRCNWRAKIKTFV